MAVEEKDEGRRMKDEKKELQRSVVRAAATKGRRK
jgi:hypothetical protein